MREKVILSDTTWNTTTLRQPAWVTSARLGNPLWLKWQGGWSYQRLTELLRHSRKCIGHSTNNGGTKMILWNISGSFVTYNAFKHYHFLSKSEQIYNLWDNTLNDSVQPLCKLWECAYFPCWYFFTASRLKSQKCVSNRIKKVVCYCSCNRQYGYLNSTKRRYDSPMWLVRTFIHTYIHTYIHR